MSKSELAVLRVRSLSDPFDDSTKSELAELLPGFLTARRWYRAKTRRIEKVEITDVISLPSATAHILILSVRYPEGDSDRYLLPISVTANDSDEHQEAVARLSAETGEQALAHSALDDAGFRDALLDLIVCEKNTDGRNGVLKALRTSSLREKCGETSASSAESFVSRAEQSNTSIIYRNRYILKLFRKLESGVNPDAEIGLFLTQRGFKNTPAVLGTLEYREQGIEENHTEQDHGVALLQQFVSNEGDAWKYTLECLQSYFERALASKRTPPTLSTEHPLMLIGQETPQELRTLIGHYLESAALLGRRTAEMHAALADPNGGVDFEPEPFSREDAEKLRDGLVDQAQNVFRLLGEKQQALSGDIAESAQTLLRAEHSIIERLAAIEHQPVTAARIRHHGDYHLGQILFTGQDFMIIDFEGEPARPLAERRAKALAMRDVAGMIRSFQYAAFAALFGQVAGIPDEPEVKPIVKAWASAWTAVVSSTYLRSYFEQSGKATFVPTNWQERRVLLDAFLLQKALYEVAYELNNRPDWLQIPLHGILSLVG